LKAALKAVVREKFSTGVENLWNAVVDESARL
jgi:hypothetical protein